MTSIHTYDPASGPALPELPPLPMGALAVGAAELLQQAADLPAPIYISVSDTQTISAMFALNRASAKAITQWARRFGGIVTTRTDTDYGQQLAKCQTTFSYYGITVEAYAYLPAAPAAPDTKDTTDER
jgi:hypothetical protein